MRQSTRNILFLTPVVVCLPYLVCLFVCVYTDLPVGAAPLSRSDTTAHRFVPKWNGKAAASREASDVLEQKRRGKLERERGKKGVVVKGRSSLVIISDVHLALFQRLRIEHTRAPHSNGAARELQLAGTPRSHAYTAAAEYEARLGPFPCPRVWCACEVAMKPRGGVQAMRTLRYFGKPWLNNNTVCFYNPTNPGSVGYPSSRRGAHILRCVFLFCSMRD